MQTLHHLGRLDQIVSLLEFARPWFHQEGRVVLLNWGNGYGFLWLGRLARLILALFVSLGLGLFNFVVTCPGILLDSLLKFAFEESLTNHFSWQELSICRILETFKEAFCLQVRIEAHRWPNLLALIPWSHTPSLPFRLGGLIGVGYSCFLFGLLHSVLVRSCGTEVQNSGSLHGLVVHCLLKSFPIVVAFIDGIRCHL